jgi:hypothetical protein
MKKITLFLTVCLALVQLNANAGELNLNSEKFQGDFQIDSTFTRDGKTYEVSASGDAGPYGRVYLSYTFTDLLGLKDRGEFTGHAWTQNDEEVNTATLQGVYLKDGKVFKMYSFDLVSNGVINLALGTVDFVAKTMKFDVTGVETGVTK